ncbi:hypothetical protein DPMN_086482 [Dreissena polymorpha]|uniref:Uncharacterized protein n=1 Tax=Dreissena polymorpha TaxID=45954 RepID=A0A9D4KRY9_DREPO|nr:hypothetical protein DPMN_086482 [Dreissena polymorpha]
MKANETPFVTIDGSAYFAKVRTRDVNSIEAVPMIYILKGTPTRLETPPDTRYAVRSWMCSEKLPIYFDEFR